MHALEHQFPGTAGLLPRVALADLPTPVEEYRLPGGHMAFWVKRDDLSGTAYGGNKVRKLEYLIGAARAQGARTLITFGTAGSNHALATGIYARESGLRSISMLTPQVNAHYVAKNLAMGLRAGIHFHAYPDDRAVARALPWVRLRCRRQDGAPPAVVPGGGSSPLGSAGFVNAGFELRQQIDAGLLPEPDRIYVALGTMGTAAGLMLGLRAAGIRSRLVVVRVVHPRIASRERFARLAAAAADLLRSRVPGFPECPPPALEPEFREEFFGERYAQFTEAGMRAVAVAAEAGMPRLEGTYTGKAFACMLADLASGRLRGQRILFWNTYNSIAFPDDLDLEDASALPPPLARYFSDPVQPLDVSG